MQNVSGVIVRDQRGKFLSRSFRWVRHRSRRRTKGAERAYVHLPEVLAEQVGRIDETAVLCLGEYDAREDCTIPHEKMMTMSQFVKALQKGFRAQDIFILD